MSLQTTDNEIKYQVWYSLQDNDKQYPITNVLVEPGSDINAIKEIIIAINSHIFGVIVPMELEIYASPASQKQLHPSTKWNQTVPWGTSEDPLTVKVSRISLTQPVTKCMFVIRNEEIHV
jgi:hypothetical protein